MGLLQSTLQGPGPQPGQGPQQPPQGAPQQGPMQGGSGMEQIMGQQQGAQQAPAAPAAAPGSGLGGADAPPDPAAMQETVKFTLMLKGMDKEDRKKAYPAVVKKLKQLDPRIGNSLDPKKPPSDKQMDYVLQKAGIDVASLQEQIDAEGKSGEGEKEGAPVVEDVGAIAKEDNSPVGQEPGMIDIGAAEKVKTDIPEKVGNIQLTKTVRSSIQKKLASSATDLNQIMDIYDQWDSEGFTLQGQVAEGVAEWKDYVKLSNKGDREMLGRRLNQKQNVDKMMLIWRKYITGVAGGEKEMKAIQATTLNMKLTPAQAVAARDRLLKSIVRDRMVHQRMLKKGFLSDVTLSKDDYSSKFMKERKTINKTIESYTARFKEANPGATDSDALQYKLQKGGF